MSYARPLLVLVVLLAPNIVRANLVITEVMYDPKGTDANREWIEIYNEGNDVTIIGGLGNTWRLYEESISGTLSRRTFSFEEGVGPLTIPSNSYAVIARNSSGFKEDFPEHNGILFFASMSLTNSEGRRLSLHDAGGNLMSSSVLYVPVPEASGTGASLQLQEDGSWIAGLPTPGLVNTAREFTLETEKEDEKEIGDDFLSLESDWPFLEEKLYINAGKNRRVFAGEDIGFRVQARFKGGQEVRARSAVWAFGNGDGGKGEAVTYRYPQPGLYRVVVRIAHNGQLHQDALLVQVLDTKEIELISADGQTAWVQNKSAYEADVSLWSLRAGGDSKIFALGTHLLPGGIVGIPFSHTSSEVSLYDSGGKEVVKTFQETRVLNRESVYLEMLSVLRERLNKAGVSQRLN